MGFQTNYKVLSSKTSFLPRFISTVTRNFQKLPYEIPERYQNAFYLANAALYDSTNWFLHRAYEVIFPSLKEKLVELEPLPVMSDVEAVEKVENIIKIMDQCNSVIDLRFPVKLDSGCYEVVRGFRAQHGLSVGYNACLGGLRIHGDITRDHMKGLAVLSTYKNACMGINMAGAQGGIKICPKDYSANELQRIVQQYTTELIKKGYSGEGDVTQPDINTSEREMTWISQSFAKYTGQSFNMASAGKSIDYGGVENYEKMPSQGAFYALNFFLNNEQVMKKVDLPIGMKGKTFIIQGLGKIGAPLAELLVEHGAICVGVKEHDAYLFESKGINLKELYEYRTKTGSIIDYGNTKPDTSDVIYTQPCDVLVLAAHQKSLACYVARDVKAKVVLEAADGPLSTTSHKILTTKSQLVVPDIYACTGASLTSFMEYLRNMRHMRINETELLRFSRNIYGNILSRLSENQEKISASGSSVESLSTPIESRIINESIECVLTDVGNEIVRLLDQHKLGTDARTAAFMIGIENIFSTIYFQKKFI